MKTDSWIGSIVWGRLGGAVMILVAFIMQGFGIEFGAEDQQAAFGAVESITAGIGAVLVIVSKAREKRKEKTDQSGKASVGVMALVAIFGALALLAAGCAGMTKAQKLATAELIASEAGHFVAMNNPGASVAVATTYQSIKDYQGDAYKAGVASGLKWMLNQKNIKESERLANDAERLLKIFGVPVPEAASVNTDWLMQFDEGDIRKVAGAFIGGMK